MNQKPIAQEESMGCAIACVASLLGISYKESLKLFNRKNATTPNFYCKDIINKLKKKGLSYRYGKVKSKTKKYINIPRTIVFIKRSNKYPVGHYLLKTEKGLMDPWINIPKINPAKAGFQKKLPGESQWIIYPEK